MARILIVEDNADLRSILEELLGHEHEVAAARGGEEGLELARRFRPEVVIMDLQLPSMSGVEAGQSIKRELGEDEVSIIALTALAQPEDEAAALDSGCCDTYMTKPASLADIRGRVAELLEKRRLPARYDGSDDSPYAFGAG